MGSESELDDRRDGKRKRSKKDKQDVKKVCRDFLRNMCDRGVSCKFEHPLDQKTSFSFCHDYQRGYCRRNVNCKFVHASIEDEKHYMKTGQLPPHLVDWYVRQRGNLPNGTDVPYCKRFFTGECWGEDCGYKHVTTNEGRSPSPQVIMHYENAHQRQVLPYCKPFMWDNCWDDNCRLLHITRSDFRKIEGRSPTPLENRSNDGDLFQRRSVVEFEGKNKLRADYYEPEIKRPYIVENDRIDDPSMNGFENSMSYQSRSQPERSYIVLEEENMMLRERITELKKRIDDLQVTNEFLLEQNARLRLQQDKNAARLTAMTVPAVTITNSVPGGNQMQQNPTPQQMVTAALRTVTASVATVPVSIGTVTPVVSLGAVSMAPVQQMQGSVMTIAQQGAPSAEPQIAPQGLPMSMSAPSVPLVSYSLMSRPVMQQPAPPSLRH